VLARSLTMVLFSMCNCAVCPAPVWSKLRQTPVMDGFVHCINSPRIVNPTALLARNAGEVAVPNNNRDAPADNAVHAAPPPPRSVHFEIPSCKI
jgi:hypothetical protein